MNGISARDYFMGRDTDRRYKQHMTEQIRVAANALLLRVNRLLAYAYESGRVDFELNPVADLNLQQTIVASGWRPPEINASTKGAAAKSKHMTGHACDVYDPDGDFDEWLLTGPGQAALVQCGLWMEHPGATKGWSHLQDLPPGSGNRVFWP